VIALGADPAPDVARLENIDFVMRHGVPINVAGKRQSFPPEGGE
jgi:hypothetical protein